MRLRGNGRPSRRAIERAALGLIASHGAEILSTARRYSASTDDAEDAYQRGLEILLTKAPTTAEEELVPWLKTVVKHEAFAIRRQRERAAPVTDDGELRDPPGPEGAPHERTERFERLRQAAEALGRLKPQEVRALTLKAEGYSYREICAITGWTYTKVNRCLTEGRRAFVERVAGIEQGAECERLAPLLSQLADGEAGADELRVLRPHLRSCLACRARLREYRAVPRRVAALVPPIALSAQGDGGPLRSVIESAIGVAQHKTAVLGERAHAAAELATGQKVAAVAASAAALAGGGATVDRMADRPEPKQKAPAAHERATDERPVPPVQPAPAPTPAPPAPVKSPAPAPTAPPPEPPPPDPAAEFAPGANPAPAAPAPAPSSSRAPAATGGGEFGP
jgi:RNA polymerase sigma factor (sigma-70 family)